ncbi:hypothetical protein N9772_00605 [Bacteroidia bacterium]|nr:hypothetical protein [Bacteroidia bacterium]
MVDISREEDKKAVIGTVTFFSLLLLLLILLSLFVWKNADAELEPSGGTVVSLGKPDDGGPDNSAAEQEEYTPQVEEEYVPDNQLTSDVEEAPAVEETKPTTKPTKPVDKPKEQEKPKETKPAERKPNEKSLFGKDKSGSGKGGNSDNGGYKGSPDGKPDGSPEGTGGKGIMGDGTGSGPAIGPGIQGGIGGFKVRDFVKPEGGVQKNGIVSLKVCVDANGNVTSVSKNSKFRDINMTNDPELVARATTALRKFKFTNVTNSKSGCGYVNFTFKVN